MEGGPGTGPGLYLCVITALAPGAAVAAAGTAVSPACSRTRLERGQHAHPLTKWELHSFPLLKRRVRVGAAHEGAAH